MNKKEIKLGLEDIALICGLRVVNPSFAPNTYEVALF